MPQVAMVREAVPGAKMVFITRRPKEAIESWIGVKRLEQANMKIIMNL